MHLKCTLSLLSFLKVRPGNLHRGSQSQTLSFYCPSWNWDRVIPTAGANHKTLFYIFVNTVLLSFFPFHPCPLKTLKYGTNSFVLPEDTCIRALQDGQRFSGKLTTSVTNVGPTNSHPHGFVFLYIRRSNKRLIYVNVNKVMYENSIFLYIVIIHLCTCLLNGTPFIVKCLKNLPFNLQIFGEPCYSQQRPYEYFIDY